MVEDAPLGRFSSLHRYTSEEHLFDEVEGKTPHEAEEAGGVVGQSQVGGRDRERAGFVTDGNIATQDQIGCHAPDRAMHHRDDRGRKSLDGA